jgi:hypothetical protein
MKGRLFPEHLKLPSETRASMSNPNAAFEEFLSELKAQLQEVRAAQVG